MGPKAAPKIAGRKRVASQAKTAERHNLPVPKDYESPLKKRREEAKAKKERAITTAHELRKYAADEKDPNEITSIYGLFLWESYHTTDKGKHIVHLHLYDAVADDKLSDLIANYKYEGDRFFESDKELMTATIWDEVEGCKGIPSPGDIVRISHFTGLAIFRDEACQFNIKLSDIHVAQKASTTTQQVETDEDDSTAVEEAEAKI